MRINICLLAVSCMVFGAFGGDTPVPSGKTISLFDGKSFDGWEGNMNVWKIADGAIMTDTTAAALPRNEFICTTREFENFDLRLKYKITGKEGFVNGGVQFWSQRVPKSTELSGYQADLGAGTDGNLYDESRRNKNLAQTKPEVLAQALKKGDWNDYRIRAEGRHIQIWLNGVQTADFTEADTSIPTKGIFGLQIHGGGKTIVSYKDLLLEELPSPDPLDPSTERASFKVAPGYEVNLFADEQLGLVKPIQMRWDAQGRLWVACTTTYPQIQPGAPYSDKIIILEDTTGAGKASKSTLFADQLFLPTGLELRDGGVYVGQGTEIIHLRDSKGLGKADERRVVLRGFGTGDDHQDINSFIWSPGGELFFCQGFHSFSSVETPWGVERLNSAGIWRFRPRRQQLNGFYGNGDKKVEGSVTSLNPWGITFDRWGQPFQQDGASVGLFYTLPAMVRSTTPTKAQPHNWGGRKLCGADFVENSHFPDDAQGLYIAGGFYENSVYRFRIQDDGSGFTTKMESPLITSSDRSFRIVDVKFGPDGALYLCDWYNPVIGHYQASFRDPRRDRLHGRIWRVTAKDRPLVKPIDLAKLGTPQLLDILKSPERFNRYQAKRLLAEKPTAEVSTALAQWIAALNPAEPNYEHNLYEALGVYETHEVVEPDLLRKLLRAKDPGARAYATRTLSRWADRLPDPLSLLAPQATDENPRVRLEALVAASYIPSPNSVEVAMAVADNPLDTQLSWALPLTVQALKPEWLQPFFDGKLTFENRPARLQAFVKADGTTDTLGVLTESIKSAKLNRENREAFLATLADIGGPRELSILLNPDYFKFDGKYDAGLHSRSFAALATAERVRKRRPVGDLSAALTAPIQSTDTNLAAEALKLAGVWKLETFRATAETIAQKSGADEYLRRAAIEALGQFAGDASKTALTGLAADPTAKIQSAAIAALTDLDLIAAAPLAGESFSKLTDESALSEIFSAFYLHDGGADALANCFAAKAPPKLVADIGLRIMASSGRRNDKLAALLTPLAGFSATSQQISAAQISDFAAEAMREGDAKRGAEIFRRSTVGCTSCHAVKGVSTAIIGPELSSLGTAYPPEFIVESILDPQKVVKEGYNSFIIKTNDGKIYQGYVRNETREEVTLFDVLQKNEIRLRAETIKTKRPSGSVMPNGLTDTFTRTEFRDLVRYLSELGKSK